MEVTAPVQGIQTGAYLDLWEYSHKEIYISESVFVHSLAPFATTCNDGRKTVGRLSQNCSWA